MYIRTEEKIYNEDFLLGVIRGSTIVKTADTIKELCDAYVVVYEKSNNHIIYNDLELAKNNANQTNEEYIIYGAIFTTKGVIFVAKLNKKTGKLELLQ